MNKPVPEAVSRQFGSDAASGSSDDARKAHLAHLRDVSVGLRSFSSQLREEAARARREARKLRHDMQLERQSLELVVRTGVCQAAAGAGATPAAVLTTRPDQRASGDVMALGLAAD